MSDLEVMIPVVGDDLDKWGAKWNAMWLKEHDMYGRHRPDVIGNLPAMQPGNEWEMKGTRDGEVTDIALTDHPALKAITPVEVGQSVIQGPDGPVPVAGWINARVFGAKPDDESFDSYAAIQAALNLARANRVPKASIVVYVPGGYYYLSHELEIDEGVVLWGDGAGNGTTFAGTRFLPHASYDGEGMGIKTKPTNGWAHGSQIRNLSVAYFPGDGIWWDERTGENAYMDNVQTALNGGDGCVIHGGTPMRIGYLQTFWNEGFGLRLDGFDSMLTAEVVSGDDNGLGLIHIENSYRQATIKLNAVKSERHDDALQPTVLSMHDMNGAHVEVGVLHCGHNTTINPSPAAAVVQTRTDETVIPGTLTINRTGGGGGGVWYPHGYDDQTSGLQVSMSDLLRSQFSTLPLITADPVTGDQQRSRRPILRSVVGTTEVIIAHGQSYTPAVVSIIPGSDARVWESSPADEYHVYLTASAAATPVTIVLDHATPQVAPILALHDSFTDVDEEAMNVHVAEVEPGAWTNTWMEIMGNKASVMFPDCVRRSCTQDFGTGATDAIIESTVNLGAFTGQRQIGYVFRANNSHDNGWVVTVVGDPANNHAYLMGWKVEGGVYTQLEIGSNTVYIDLEDDFVLRMECIGQEIRVLVDGEYYATYQIDATHATNTRHGMRTGDIGDTSTANATFDDMRIWVVPS